MSEENKSAFRRIVNAFSTGDLSAFDEVIAPQFVDHNPGQGPEPAGMKQMATMLRAAFPDLLITIEDLIAEGDKVMARVTSHGAHRGEFMGAAPTNKVVSMQEIHIGRFPERKLVEHWGLEDSLGLMQQLGLVPEMGLPG